jgi:hypothetical protein
MLFALRANFDVVVCYVNATTTYLSFFFSRLSRKFPPSVLVKFFDPATDIAEVIKNVFVVVVSFVIDVPHQVVFIVTNF